MSIFEAAILGLIQGLTEFIPVSSSGHLVIAQYFFSGSSDHSFLEWIDLGTLCALIIYFRSRICDIGYEIVHDHDFTLARNVIITAIPVAVIGLVAGDFINNNAFFGNIWVVLAALALIGTVMIILPFFPRAAAVKSPYELDIKRALAIGIAQCLALVPGVSRSGSTIIAGRLGGLSAPDAAEYSFLVSIPVMTGVCAKLFVKSSDRSYLMHHLVILSVSNAVAFASGLLAIGFLMRYLRGHSLALFGWYRVGLAVVIGALLYISR